MVHLGVVVVGRAGSARGGKGINDVLVVQQDVDIEADVGGHDAPAGEDFLGCPEAEKGELQKSGGVLRKGTRHTRNEEVNGTHRLTLRDLNT